MRLAITITASGGKRAVYGNVTPAGMRRRSHGSAKFALPILQTPSPAGRPLAGSHIVVLGRTMEPPEPALTLAAMSLKHARPSR